MAKSFTSVWSIGFSACSCFVKDCNNNPNAFKWPSSDKRSRILLLNLLVTKCLTKTKASFQYQGPAISLEASCTMPCKHRVTLWKYLGTRWHRCHYQWTTWMEQCRNTNVEITSRIWKKFCINPSTNVDMAIIDGTFFYHLLYQPLSTFPGPVNHLLRQVRKHRGREIHLVFDKTISPSIKDAERNKRSHHWGMA